MTADVLIEIPPAGDSARGSDFVPDWPNPASCGRHYGKQGYSRETDMWAPGNRPTPQDREENGRRHRSVEIPRPDRGRTRGIVWCDAGTPRRERVGDVARARWSQGPMTVTRGVLWRLGAPVTCLTCQGARKHPCGLSPGMPPGWRASRDHSSVAIPHQCGRIPQTLIRRGTPWKKQTN